MLLELISFDSFSCKPHATYNVKKDVSETSFAPIGESLSRGGGSTINVFDFGGRLFIWRSDLDKLCVHELSFVNEVRQNSIELIFSNSKVLNCGIYYENSGLYILVTTVDGIYQHRFPPYKKTYKYESILKDYKDSDSQFHPLKGLSSQGIICSTTSRFNDEYSLFAFGLKGGSVMLVSISEAGQVVNELTVASYQFNPFSGIFPFSSKQAEGGQEHPVSVAFLTNESDDPTLVCVSKDHYFRAWDLKHNQCISSIDLLRCLSKYSSYFDDFSDTHQRTQAFAPGVNHCVKSSKNFALIYLELQPTKKFSLPVGSMSYWIWIRSVSTSNRKVDFDVVRVERTEQMSGSHSSFTAAVSSLIDFSPFLVFEDDSDAFRSSVDIDSNKIWLPTSLGIWSVVDLPTVEGSSQPVLHRETFSMNASNTSSNSSSTPTGNSGIKLWQEPLPQSIFQQAYCVSKEPEVAFNISAFMDFIFTPGRFTKDAICKAYETLRKSQSHDWSSASLDNSLFELNEIIKTSLMNEISSHDLPTVLKTFHQSVVDYHQRALEPLGLFYVQSTGDVVVVHRSGISVARSLQSAEEALLNAYYLISVAESSMEARSREHLLFRCRKIVNGLGKSQVWLEHERRICDNFDNFLHTEAVLNQLLNELKSEGVGKLFTAESDDSMDQLEEAFYWILDLISSADESDELYESVLDEEDSRFSHGIGSSLSAELLARGVQQATCMRLRFSVALYFLWRLCTCYSCASFHSSTFENSLLQNYRCLAIIHWLTVTRSAADSEMNDHRQSWALLKVLGMDFPPRRKVFASNLLGELLLSFPELSSGFPNAISWQAQASKIITTLQRRLCPVVNHGETLIPLIKYLLFNAKTMEILKLCKCLAPSAFSGIELEKLTSRGCQETGAGKSRLDFVTDFWWSGDLNVLYMCAFLAFAWSKYTYEAIDQHIEGSLYLRNRLLSRFHSSTTECPQELKINDSIATPCSLVEKLFSAEFSIASLGLSESIIENQSPIFIRYLIDEVQIRYLIKAMPVLEVTDKPHCVITLCEYGLEIIQNAARTACDEGLLDFESNSQLKSLLLGNSETSMESDKSGMQTSSPTDLFPLSAIRTDDLTFRAVARNLSELEAVLRTRIFRHELNLGNIDRAHELVMANPDKAKQRDCLHLLITELCDRQMAPLLVNLEYGSLEDELISTLESRARATDILQKPPPRRQALHITTNDCLEEFQEQKPGNIFYDVLYAYYIRRSRFHSAAEVCFEEAIRLAEEAALLPPTLPRRSRFDGGIGGVGNRALLVLHHQAICLANCINTLELLTPKDQWIVRPDTKIAFVDSSGPVGLRDDIAWAFDVDDEVINDNEPLSENEEVDAEAGEVSIRQAEGRKILQLVDLKHHYLVVQARLRLAQVSWDLGVLRVGSTSLHDLYSALIVTALYDEAFKLLLVFNLDSESLISAISSRCVALMEAKQTSNDGLCPHLPALTNTTSPLRIERDLVAKSIASLTDYFNANQGLMMEVNRNNDLLDLYWLLLKVLLTNLDGNSAIQKGSRWSLHLLACRTLLTSTLNQQTSSIQLPGWLMHSLLSSGSSGPVVPLLRLLLDHNQLIEASRLAISALSAAVGPETGQCPALLKKMDLHLLQATLHSAPDRVASSSLCIPHGLLFCLLDSLSFVAQNNTSYSTMYEELKNLMKKYYSMLSSVETMRRSLASR